MNPPCRRAADLTSGDHPEPDPDLPLAALTPASAAAGPSTLRPQAIGPWPPGPAGRVSGKEVRGMPATPGGRNALRLPPGRAGHEDVRPPAGPLVGRVGEL